MSAMEGIWECSVNVANEPGGLKIGGRLKGYIGT